MQILNIHEKSEVQEFEHLDLKSIQLSYADPTDLWGRNWFISLLLLKDWVMWYVLSNVYPGMVKTSNWIIAKSTQLGTSYLFIWSVALRPLSGAGHETTSFPYPYRYYSNTPLCVHFISPSFSYVAYVDIGSQCWWLAKPAWALRTP